MIDILEGLWFFEVEATNQMMIFLLALSSFKGARTMMNNGAINVIFSCNSKSSSALIRISLNESFFLTIHPSNREIGNCVSSSIVRFNRAIDNIKMSLKCEHELLRKLIEQSYRDADIYSFNRMCLD